MRNFSQRPIGSNWPLFLAAIISLVAHGAVFFYLVPEKVSNILNTSLEVRLSFDNPPPSVIAEEGGSTNNSNHEISDAQKISNIRNDREHFSPPPQSPVFFPSHLMDRPPFPVSAPTPGKYLDKTSLPATIIRLRLFIDSSGRVVDIKIKLPEYLEDKVTRQIAEMFYATSFVPGNIRGIDLPCYMDIELDIASYIE